MKPVVVILGRPNVGKSTIFNRLTGTQDALVDDMPGVTRDRNYGNAEWNGVSFTVVDTGGFMSGTDDFFMEHIQFQIRQAVSQADAVLLVFDGRAGISPFDREAMSFLQNVSCPIFYLVNKIDRPEREIDIVEFYRLGVKDLYPVSGAHGYGIPDLLDDLVKALPEAEPEPPANMIKLALVGRPNVGKSTLVNRLLGQERMIVSEVPGTTRESVDTVCEINGRSYLLIDTAGLRRKSRVSAKLEKFSAVKTLKSLDRCDIALILLDASEGVTDQDVAIAGYAFERDCGCIFLVNKWDLAKEEGKDAKNFYDDLQEQAKFLSFAPALAISASTGFHVKKIFELIDAVHTQFTFTIKTGALNNIFERATRTKEPPFHKGRRVKLNYAVQVATGPPTFVCFANSPAGVHFSYKRYLINAIRRETGLDKTPIRLFFRVKPGRIDFGTLKPFNKMGGKKDRRR